MAAAIDRYWRYERARARTGGSGGLTGHAPVPPLELIYALRVSIADLRPWEYDAMPFWQYEEIRHARRAWDDAQAALPLGDVGQTRLAAPEIAADGTGPQVVP